MYYHKNIKTLLHFYSEKKHIRQFLPANHMETGRTARKTDPEDIFSDFCMHPAQKEDCNNENDKRFKEKSGVGGKPE